MPPMTKRDESRPLDECQEVLGYAFRDPAMLREALTHASGANHRLSSNERLEFLGDAILGAVVCDLLFRKYPDYQEGELTRIKSIVVSRLTCARSPRLWASTHFCTWVKGWALANARLPRFWPMCSRA